MSKRDAGAVGLRLSLDDARHRWTRSAGGLTSRPVRCRQDEWYIVRARLADTARIGRMTVLVDFRRAGRVLGQRRVCLYAPGGADARELLGWVQTPRRATCLALTIPDRAVPGCVQEFVLHDVAERDPRCHPAANVPRWSAVQPPFPVRRIVLPAALHELATVLHDATLDFTGAPGTRAALQRRIRGAACVLDPEWVTALGLTWADLERLAAAAWLVVDLATTARLLRDAGLAGTEARTYASGHGLMSACVEYCDVPTRGLALQDVVPYALRDPRGGFATRVLLANRSWQRYADAVGFASLLSSETPWERRHGDVLSAARPVGRGELLATDLPWLVAGRHGPLVAPCIAGHLLRMHLAAPLPDHVQYWNRWEDGTVVVRDLADFALRQPALQAVRWASPDPALAHLGLTLRPPNATRHTLIRTGRIDSVGVHDGLPPEPMTIFMKWLAREVAEQTSWGRRHLAGRAVTWQFDTADGLKYASQFDSAAPLAHLPVESIRVRLDDAGTAARAARAGRDDVILMTKDEGLYGDTALVFQHTLTRRLRAVLERE